MKTPKLTSEALDNLGEVVEHCREVEGLAWDIISKKLEIPMETCRNAYRRLKKKRQDFTEQERDGATHTKQAKDGETFEAATEDKNNQSCSNVGIRITNLEQLLEFAKVDLNVWKVDHYLINKWEGFRRDESKDITMTKGVMDGWTKDTGDLRILPLIQIKAWLVRKNPEPLTPFVSIVKVSGHVHPLHKYTRGNMGLALCIFDAHMGFKRDMHTGKLEPVHDRRALNIVSQIAAAYPFEYIIWGGDEADMTDITDHFIRTPEFDYTLQPTLNEMGWWMSEICSACPDAKKYYLEGNHEKRLHTAIISKVPQIYNIKNINMGYAFWELRNLLSLDDMGIEWKGPYPNGEVWITNNLRVVHGAETSAVAVVNKSDCSTVYGHNHKLEMASRTVWSRNGYKTIRAFCPGFLGRMDGIVPGVKEKQNWSQGFAIVQFDKDGETIEHIPIYNGSAIYDRSRWVGVDYGDKF